MKQVRERRFAIKAPPNIGSRYWLWQEIFPMHRDAMTFLRKMREESAGAFEECQVVAVEIIELPTKKRK